MSAEARSGLRKIRALGIAVDDPIIGYSPRISLREPSFAALQQAIEQSHVVTFAYLKPGEEAPRTRRVQPLALIEYEARWHVYGVDLDVGADRTFLLSRIVGDVVVTRQSFDPSLRDGAGDRALAGLEELAERQLALLEVNPGTEAALRLSRRARPAPQGIRVPYVDVAGLRRRARFVRTRSPRGGTRRRCATEVIARLGAALRAARRCPVNSSTSAHRHRSGGDHAPARAVPHRQGRGLARRGGRRVRRHARADAADGREAHGHRAARRRRLLADAERALRHQLGPPRRAGRHRHHELASGSSARPG